MFRPPTDKLQAWLARGRRPLSAEEIRAALERTPRFIPLPREIIVLDGVLEVDGRIAVGATPMKKETGVLILTPLSDEETISHEMIHMLGLGEFAAYTLSPILFERMKRGIIPRLFPRRVELQPMAPPSEAELFSRFTIVPEVLEELRYCWQCLQTGYQMKLPPELKRYRVLVP